MRAFKLTIEYDGSAFVGWQSQLNGRAVQDEITRVLRQVLQEEVNLIGAGRTDSGVHARGQVAGFRSHSMLSPGKILSALNGMLPRDICIHAVEEVPPDFHARFDARIRRYRYTIATRPTAIARKFVWELRSGLDVAALQAVAAKICGSHDFGAFCKHEAEVEDCVCMVTASCWTESVDRLTYEIVADRFVHGMVRALVGTMVEIGRGRTPAGEFDEILASRDRRRAGESAPACGLCLEEVLYRRF